MLSFLTNVTSGDLSLCLIVGYVTYYCVQSITNKINELSYLTNRFVDSVETLADNSHSISQNLGSISHVANKFTTETANNNWVNNILELIKMYIPLITQLYASKPLVVSSPLFSRGTTGPIGPTGPSGQTGAIGPTCAPGVFNTMRASISPTSILTSPNTTTKLPDSHVDCYESDDDSVDVPALVKSSSNTTSGQTGAVGPTSAPVRVPSAIVSSENESDVIF